jgi:hypothetical protein
MKSPLGRVGTKRELLNVQKAFFEIITRPLGASDSMARDKRVAQMIEDGARLTSHERLQLYAQQYWWRVLDSLNDDFPGVRKVVGDRRFAQLLVRYLTRFKSQSFTLRYLGSRMESFVRRDRKLPQKLRALAADVAALEWAQMEVFEASELEPLSAAEMTDPDFGTFQLVTQSYIRLLALKHAADDWVSAGRDDFLRDATSNVRLHGRAKVARGEGAARRTATTYLAVYRLDNRIRFRRLTAAMYHFLLEFQRGGRLELVLRRVMKAYPKLDPAEVGPAFREFSSLGWICRKEGKTR